MYSFWIIRTIFNCPDSFWIVRTVFGWFVKCWIIQTCSRLYGQFLFCPNSFRIVRTLFWLSGQFRYWPESFFQLCGQFLGCPESFWIIRTVSRLPGQFVECPDSFQTIRTVSLSTGQFWTNALSQKLSGFAKTFRIAMLPRYHGFSDSVATSYTSITEYLFRATFFWNNILDNQVSLLFISPYWLLFKLVNLFQSLLSFLLRGNP